MTWRILKFATLDSTNNRALMLGEVGTVVVADEQTAGRGQYQREWHSSAGTSLLMSMTVSNEQRVSVLIARAAVAVASALEDLTRLGTSIKWPNDILVNGRKICGILAERQTVSVVGMGINLTQTRQEFDEQDLAAATSVLIETGLVVERDTMLDAVLRNFNRTDLEDEWRRRLGLEGQLVMLELMNGDAVHGLLQRVSFEEVVIGSRTIAPEHIRHVTAIPRAF